MKPEKYIKKYALKHKNDNEPYTSILLYSLVYIKRHKTLYFFDSIFNDDYTDFEIKIINKSSKKILEEQLRDMFIFSRELEKYKQEWINENELAFDENSIYCKYCGQEYPLEKKEQLTEKGGEVNG